MKVHGASPGPHGADNAEARRRAANRTDSEEGDGTQQTRRIRSEDVAVSSTAQALGRVRAPESPDLDRIERLKRAIEDGSFRVDAEKIAETMLREEVK